MAIKRSKSLLFWLTFGLLLRLILMPFFAHEDLISIYTKAFWAAQNGKFYPAIFGYSWFLFNVLVIKFYSLFNLDLTGFFVSDPLTLLANLSSVLAHPQVLRFIFLLKLPFLLLELACIFVFLKILPQLKKKISFVSFWVFNPFLIYALYFHGRNEILVILFIALYLLWLKRKKTVTAAWMLGLAISFRLYPLVLVPLLLPLISRRLKPALLSLAGLITPTLLFASIARVLQTPTVAAVHKIPLLEEFLLSATIPLGFGTKIYLLPLALIGFYLFWLAKPRGFQGVWRGSYIALLIFLSLSFFHPQYLAWLAPFTALSFALYPQINKQLWIAFLFQFFSWLLVLLYWGKGTTLGLLQPVDYYLFNHFGSPLNWFSNNLPGVDLVSWGRTLLAGSNLYLIWLLLKNKPTRA